MRLIRVSHISYNPRAYDRWLDVGEEPEPPECPECYTSMEEVRHGFSNSWECPECKTTINVDDDREPPDPYGYDDNYEG